MKQYSPITLLTFLTLTIPAHCSQQPWYNTFVSEKNAYKLSVSAINIAMGIRTMIHKKIMGIDPDKSIKVLKNRLAQQEENIRTTEENMIRAIIEENGLSEKYATSLLKRITKIHESRREYLSKQQLDIAHDKNIDSELVDIIDKQLQKAGLTINSIHLINSSTPSSQGWAAASMPPSYFILVQNGTISVSHNNKIPANITFYPKFHLYSKKIQQAMCIHEATHIIEGHGNTQQDIAFYINFYNKKTYADLQKDTYFKRLVQIHEQQAEILPSLQDSKTASLMRACRAKIYYPNMLYQEHYRELSDIDETHKMIAYLEDIKNIRTNQCHQ